jgi:hypothetical protein
MARRNKFTPFGEKRRKTADTDDISSRRRLDHGNTNTVYIGWVALHLAVVPFFQFILV